MSFRNYTTESIPLPPFIACEIAKLSYGQQDALDEYVLSYCYENNYLERGVEDFRSYNGAVYLCTELTKEEKDDVVVIVCLVIAEWFRQRGFKLI